jgi:hypothetical protein
MILQQQLVSLVVLPALLADLLVGGVVVVSVAMMGGKGWWLQTGVPAWSLLAPVQAVSGLRFY